MAQTFPISALPGYALTVDVVDGYLIATVCDETEAECASASWQIADPV